ncbi:MAG: DNA methyltransferase [Planctomycetota bacterium]
MPSGDHLVVTVDVPNASADRANPAMSPAALPWGSFSTAAGSRDYARDLTHPLYRYPARMSPQLARALILGLTEPGDVVLDPFIGGGTTAIEALSNGRRAVCSDLNSLACFVTRAKAWPVGLGSLRAYEKWSASAISGLLHSPRVSLPLVTRDGSEYAPRTHASLLRLRAAALGVNDPSARRLALLTVLRVAQVCFDCRRTPPSPSLLPSLFQAVAEMVLNRMELYASTCRRLQWPFGLRRSLRVLQSDAERIAERLRLAGTDPVSLILTSPPYPGVHVLYHRWQVYGRRETALPYHLLQLNDGSFESHYTFGSRKKADTLYFGRLAAVFASLRCLTTRSTLVAQVVGFCDPERHLPRFRQVMDSVGFDEVMDPDSPDSVIARIIPRRRWYAELSTGQGSGHEFVLIHRPRSSGARQHGPRVDRESCEHGKGRGRQ